MRMHKVLRAHTTSTKAIAQKIRLRRRVANDELDGLADCSVDVAVGCAAFLSEDVSVGATVALAEDVVLAADMPAEGLVIRIHETSVTCANIRSEEKQKADDYVDCSAKGKGARADPCTDFNTIFLHDTDAAHDNRSYHRQFKGRNIGTDDTRKRKTLHEGICTEGAHTGDKR